MGNYNPGQNWACFVHYFRITKICLKKKKPYKYFKGKCETQECLFLVETSDSWVTYQNNQYLKNYVADWNFNVIIFNFSEKLLEITHNIFPKDV